MFATCAKLGGVCMCIQPNPILKDSEGWVLVLCNKPKLRLKYSEGLCLLYVPSLIID